MTRPLSLLVVTTVHPPGDARIRHRQIASFLDAGDSVTFAAPFSGYGVTEPDERINTVDLPRSRGRRRVRALVRAVREVRSRVSDHDVVIVHDPELLVALAAVGRRRRRKTVAVWDVHEDLIAQLQIKPWLPQGARWLAVALVKVAYRWAERNVRLIIAERSYVGLFNAPTQLVPNSVRLAPLCPMSVEPRVLYLGAVSRARGVEQIVAIGAETRDEVRIEVIGGADSAASAILNRATLDGDVAYLGFVPNNVALQHLDGALVGLSLLADTPNYAHSNPTKILEYFAHGVPVISTPNPASAELIQASGGGFLVPFGSVEAVVDRVRDLARSPDLREEMGQRARAYVEVHHNWDVDFERYHRVLESWVRGG